MLNKCFFVLVFIIAASASAQNILPNVPENYTLKTAQDYETYRPNAMECIKWLVNSHPDEEQERRMKALSFVLSWIGGSPTIHVNIGTKFFAQIKSEPAFKYGQELSYIFILSKTLYIVENPNEKDEAKSEMYALIKVMDMYKKIRNSHPVEYSKNIEEFISLHEKKKLEKLVKKEAKKAYN